MPLGVAASFWAIKAVLVAASLGTILLVWRCAELLELDPVKAIVLVGLNPIVLVWGLGGDHNDFLMVFAIVLGFYLLLRARAAGASDRRAVAADSSLAGRSARTNAARRRRSPSGSAAGCGRCRRRRWGRARRSSRRPR